MLNHIVSIKKITYVFGHWYKSPSRGTFWVTLNGFKKTNFVTWFPKFWTWSRGRKEGNYKRARRGIYFTVFGQKEYIILQILQWKLLNNNNSNLHIKVHLYFIADDFFFYLLFINAASGPGVCFSKAVVLCWWSTGKTRDITFPARYMYRNVTATCRRCWSASSLIIITIIITVRYFLLVVVSLVRSPVLRARNDNNNYKSNNNNKLRVVGDTDEYRYNVKRVVFSKNYKKIKILFKITENAIKIDRVDGLIKNDLYTFFFTFSFHHNQFHIRFSF